MVKLKYIFNEIRDIAPVALSGAVDLAALALHDALPSDVSASAVEFNGIEEPGSILGRPSDVFDEIAMRKAVKRYKPTAKDPVVSEYDK